MQLPENYSKFNQLKYSLTTLVFKQLMDFWKHYLFALVCLFALHYFQAQIPLLAKQLGDLVSVSKLTQVETGYFLFLAVAIIFFRTCSRLFFFYPARIQQRDLRLKLVEMLEAVHPRKYEQLGSGQLFQVVINDMNRLRGLIGFGLLQVGNIILAMLVFLPKIKSFNPDLLIAFTPLFVGVVIFSTLVTLCQPFSKKGMDAHGEVQNFIIESYNAKSTIKNYHAEKSMINIFNNLSLKELKLFILSTMGAVFSVPLIRLSFAVSLLWGAKIIYKQGLPASNLIFFSGFLYLILEPLMFLSWIGIVTVTAVSGWKRVQELIIDLERKDERLDQINLSNSMDANQIKVPFWNHLLTFNFKKNHWYVFTGTTGCGKSELLKNIADAFISKDMLVSMVSQEPYLFNATIRENIFLAKRPTEDDEKCAMQLLSIFGLDVLDTNSHRVLDIEVGENGKKISGGQAKRLALIRSIFQAREVIIWDDPFSSVDFVLENKIMGQLKQVTILQEKLIIMSSHRLSTVRYCDEVILVDNVEGIIEQAPVDILKQESSKIAKYFKKQLV